MRARAVNIGPRGRARRLRLGLLGLALGAGVVAALVAAGAGPGWALGAFVPFVVGILGIVQAREGT